MDENIKRYGQVYTPDFIIEFILNNTIAKVNVIEMPFVKVIDVSCGIGYFLIKVYDKLYENFRTNLYNLQNKFFDQTYRINIDGNEIILNGNEYWREENLPYHILQNCIYGADIDPNSVNTTIDNLLHNAGVADARLNIVNCDSLVAYERMTECEIANDFTKMELKRFWKQKFDFVVGNPPYVGHKQLDGKYKKWLLEEYREVFKDKSDIAYCFFKRILDVLKEGGKASIICNRYFMESPTGKTLRTYLKEKSIIEDIVDFYGAEVFKGVGVATAIYTFRNKPSLNVVPSIHVYKINNDEFKFEKEHTIRELLMQGIFQSFNVSYTDLDDNRWMLISPQHRKIYEKIKRKSVIKLGDIVENFQGIITGCDNAFVMSKDQISKNNIEKSIIKEWIKNKNISKFNIEKSELRLIYSDSISDFELYKNSINYIEQYREKLSQRRECQKSIREWYQLQWGRNEKLFEQPKIVYPYKSKNNRFAIDLNNYYFSADVYSFFVKDEYKDRYSLEFLAGILNSSIYEFYFKLFAKKMCKGGVYDYYPNSVLELCIPDPECLAEVESIVKEIMNCKNSSEEIYKVREIDMILKDYFKIEDSEMRSIYRACL